MVTDAVRAMLRIRTIRLDAAQRIAEQAVLRDEAYAYLFHQQKMTAVSIRDAVRDGLLAAGVPANEVDGLGTSADTIRRAAGPRQNNPPKL